MKQLLMGLTLLASASAAGAAEPIEGRWTNPKQNVIIHVARCGDDYCGQVAWASDRAKEIARKGGTENLVGARLMTGLRPDGRGAYKGRAFDPKRGLHGTATIRKVGEDNLEVRGCAFAGIFCKTQRWTRVSG
jgi:uncharacterized protein (DUF2147 family)